jgi:hypothetical protein
MPGVFAHLWDLRTGSVAYGNSNDPKSASKTASRERQFISRLRVGSNPPTQSLGGTPELCPDMVKEA